ncbi:MAG: helix-turn-helix transcriptional regulator [Dehalococcoidia bacterium]|nr:helix-turn-helix transcriptional regulator [Dehalococcoidia bacterium]
MLDGASLRAERVRLGMSQRDLAAELDVPANTVARWERGELAIHHPRVLELALEMIAQQAKEVLA